MSTILPATPTLLAFAAASFAILVVPGPSVGFVVARSVEYGRLAGFYSMLGLETGAALHAGAAALGLTALVAASGTAFVVLHWVGACYLAWLGIGELRRMRAVDSGGSVRCTALHPLRLYRDGVLVDLLNPKTALFFLAFLPQFVDRSRGSVSVQAALLGLIFVGMAALCDGLYAIIAARLSGGLRASARTRKWIRISAATVYFCLAGLAALT